MALSYVDYPCKILLGDYWKKQSLVICRMMKDRMVCSLEVEGFGHFSLPIKIKCCTITHFQFLLWCGQLVGGSAWTFSLRVGGCRFPEAFCTGRCNQVVKKQSSRVPVEIQWNRRTEFNHKHHTSRTRSVHEIYTHVVLVFLNSTSTYKYQYS